MVSKSDAFKHATATIKKIGEGAASLTYEDSKNPGIIIKEAILSPRNADGKYIARQKRGNDIIDKIRESGRDYGVNLPEFISSVKSFDAPIGAIPHQSVKETKLPGVMLNNAEYLKLKDITKNHLAKELAQFMFSMHNLEKPQSATMQDRIHDILFTFKIVTQNADKPEVIQTKIIGFINLFKNKRLKQLLTSAASVLWQDIDKDEIIVTTHGDLRWPNIIYDKHHTKLGVIDFENARTGHIYRDFVSSPVSFHWDFVQRIIKQYNKIQKTFGRSVRINTDNIKKLLIARLVNKIVNNVQTEIIHDESLDIEHMSKEELRNILISKIEPNLIQELAEYGLMEKLPNQILHNKKYNERN